MSRVPHFLYHMLKSAAEDSVFCSVLEINNKMFHCKMILHVGTQPNNNSKI